MLQREVIFFPTESCNLGLNWGCLRHGDRQNTQHKTATPAEEQKSKPSSSSEFPKARLLDGTRAWNLRNQIQMEKRRELSKCWGSSHKWFKSKAHWGLEVSLLERVLCQRYIFPKRRKSWEISRTNSTPDFLWCLTWCECPKQPTMMTLLLTGSL